ncbi:MAG TPA: AMP-binding protein [Vicinamibacteria bacterium]|nr:AMP-binding protein [Vicinamibacteria bacterium]
MAPETETPLPRLAVLEQRVVEVVRTLARETGGERAARLVTPSASLEREVGLGSLERVELLLRLERTFGRTLDDRCLALDSASGLARALLETTAGEPLQVPQREAAPQSALPLGEVRTLSESLWRRASLEPERLHVHLRDEDGGEQAVSYGRLWREAAAVAGGLLARGVRRGDTVALMLPTGLDFLRVFAGIQLARAVPVPIYPPLRLDRLEEFARRQSAILADAGVGLLVTVPRARPVVSLLSPSVPTLRAVLTADELANQGAPVAVAQGEGPDLALIQYTSGSTGQPKGVQLTHDNLLANIRAIVEGVAISPTDVGVSWLPLYHDMGLIGSWLLCLHQGVPLTLLPPTAFLARPERWLWAIHQRAATLSPAPNFAYELCARRVPDRALEGLDLSSWRAAFNGAEPVSPATVERFVRRFGRCGFRREAMLPVYGLAENSVALAVPPLGRGPRIDRVSRDAFQRGGRADPAAEDDTSALQFVSAGRVLPEHELRVVDEAGADLPERAVGRLVFRGPSMTSGYHGQPQATAAITLPGGWLDSGDLAYLADDEVYVCGRRKDLVIKGGRNLVPQEIEEAAAAVEGVRRGCVAAFGVPSTTLGTEALVVVAETRARDDAARQRLATGVTEAVAAAVGVPPDEVVLVPPGAVPKTSSGKLRRASARELYLDGRLGRRPGTTLGQRLRLPLAAAGEWLRPLLRRAGRGLYAAWLALTLAPALGAAWLLLQLVPSRRFAFRVARAASRFALRLTGCRFETRGLERLPREGALVLACNHASYADVAVLVAALPVDLVFVAKREVLRYPLIGALVRRCGHLTVDRWDAQQTLADTEAVDQALRHGARVLFFPEGTFRAATGLRPFRLGAFKAAATAAVPVVPLALRGTRQVMRGDWSLPHPARVRLWVGDAVAPSGTELSALVALRDQVAEAIAGECGEPRLEGIAAGPERVSAESST